MWHLCMPSVPKCLSFTLIDGCILIRNVVIIVLADYWGQSSALPSWVSVFCESNVDKLIQLKCATLALMQHPLSVV